MFADLHLHSCFSDGTRTPEEVAAELHVQGIGLAALADHNSCEGYPRFKAACDALDIATLRGMELDCMYTGMVIHVLGYGFAPSGKVMSLATHSRQLLLEMSRDLVRRMTSDYPTLSLEDYDAWDYSPTLGGWKGLHYLVYHHIIQKPEDGMKLYATYGCDYSNYPFPSVTAVCAAVRDAGGIPVLAHPANWFSQCTAAALAAHLDALRAAGIGGVECYYPSHTPTLTARCLAYCSKHSLLVTAGSDCHGGFVQTIKGVHYHIGAVQVPVGKLSLGRLVRTGV